LYDSNSFVIRQMIQIVAPFPSIELSSYDSSKLWE
jgi:hypothetical protein